MPSITAAIKQAAKEITTQRTAKGWRLIDMHTATSRFGSFWAVSEWCRNRRITRALELLGVPEQATLELSLREGTYSKVVRDVMRERTSR